MLRLCGATAATFDVAYGYALWVVILGGPCTILNTLLANLIRAEGGAGPAAFGVSLGGVLNLLLDPLFVLPRFLGLGAVGAGMATALSNGAAVIFFAVYLFRRRGATYLSLAPARLRGAGAELWPILSIGFPSALQYALTVVATAAQARFVAQYPTEAVAALGIVKKLDQLPLYFSIGVSNGLLPLLAYNHAAGDHRRRERAFRLGTAISFGFALVCLVCYEIFADRLTAVFIQDPATVTYGAVFLRCMVTAMPLMALCYPLIIQFQAMGRARESLICSILRKGVLDIPLLFLLDGLFPLYGCMWVQPSWMPYLWRSPSGFTGGSSGICCAERRRAHDPFGTRFFKRQHLPEHSDPGGPHDGGPAHQRPLQRGGPHLSGPAARSPGPDGAGDW